MELIVERPLASLPEKAWIDEEKQTLEVDYHLYNHKACQYEDMHKSIPLEDIGFMTETYGTRGGFKKLGLRIKDEYWYISKNHRPLTYRIIELLQGKVNSRKDIEDGKQKA